VLPSNFGQPCQSDWLERKKIRVDDNVQKFEVDDLIWVNDLDAMDQQICERGFRVDARPRSPRNRSCRILIATVGCGDCSRARPPGHPQHPILGFVPAASSDKRRNALDPAWSMPAASAGGPQ
jgi:hypothetical protein